ADNTNSNALIWDSGRDLRFGVETSKGSGWSEKMRITASGNVGIGTSSPQALLDLATTTSGRSAIIVPRGTTAFRPPTGVNGMIRYNSNTNKFEAFENSVWVNMTPSGAGTTATGNSGAIQFSNGSGAFSSNNNIVITSAGLLGVGIASPASDAPLHVYKSSTGIIRSLVQNPATGASVQARYDLATGTANSYSTTTINDNSGAPFLQHSVGSALTGTYYDSPLHSFRNVAGVEAMRVSGGDLGIGTVPSFRLDVAETMTNTSGTLTMANKVLTLNPSSSSSAIVYGDISYVYTSATAVNSNVVQGKRDGVVHVGTGTLSVAYGTSGGVTNNSSGNITTAYAVAGDILNVSTGTISNAVGLYGGITRSSGTITNGYGVYTGSVQATNKWSFYAADSTAPSYFAGKIGVGTTNPGTKLQVAGVISPSADNTYDLGTSALRFKDIYAANNVIQTSDARLKTDVKDSDLGLGFINNLRPVSYYWKEGDPKLHYGVIAQETEKALSDAKKLSGRESEVDNVIVTHDEKTDRYGVRYTELIAPIIKAIQELYNELMGHDSRLTALEAKDAAKDRSIASKADKAEMDAKLKAKDQEIEELKQENTAIKAYLCAKDPNAAICK
ncbi:MAG: tail fiber domain-containing protein, partial [Pyrinomonadaceae bacterium]